MVKVFLCFYCFNAMLAKLLINSFYFRSGVHFVQQRLIMCTSLSETPLRTKCFHDCPISLQS